MFRLSLRLYRKNSNWTRRIILIIIFFIFGFVLSFSSGELFPLIYIHEAGHWIAAKIVNVSLEKQDVNTYLMYPETGRPVADYVRVLRAGYMMEINIWGIVVLSLMLFNRRRIRHTRECIHFPAALFPGYAFATFRRLYGSSDMTKISALLKIEQTVAVRNFIIRELCVIVFTAAVYSAVLLIHKHRMQKSE